MSPAATDEPKITTQYRAKSKMMYELEWRGRAFELAISSDRDDDHEASVWRVVATREGTTLGSAEGATASAALDALASSCRSTVTNGLAELDWKAVASALARVRAI